MRILLLLLLLIQFSISQDAAPVVEQDELVTIHEQIAQKTKELSTIAEKIKAAKTDDEKASLQKSSDELKNTIQEFRSRFEKVATGIDASTNKNVDPQNFSINTMLKEVSVPIVREVKQLTDRLNNKEEYRVKIRRLQDDEKGGKGEILLQENALKALEEKISKAQNQDVKNELLAIQKNKKKEIVALKNELVLAKQDLKRTEENSPSVIKTLSEMFVNFWKARGLNLILSLITGAVVWYVLDRVRKWLNVYGPIHKKYPNSIAVKAIDISVRFCSVLLAFFAVAIVLILREDAFLLTVWMLILLGLAWASRETLPPYFNELKLILNLGTVRVGERVIINGLPWQVDALNFFCDLSNPELVGGKVRVSAKSLLPHFSRPSLPNEPWFPCKKDDWVLLDDGMFGKVIQQTPEQVVVLKLGGSMKTFPTAAFLAKNPENYQKSFRVATHFGLDYQYQKIATTKIPELIKTHILQVLLENYKRENVISVNVEFASAGASSLDYFICVDMDGSVAKDRAAIERLLQKCAVETANENDWIIPFPQLTIHQYKNSAEC